MIMRLTWACAFVTALLFAGAPAMSQTEGAAADSTVTTPAATATPQTTPPPAETKTASAKPPLRDRIYYGGSVVFSFGSDVSRIGVYPMIAYKIRPKWSLGVELGYERVNYDDFDQSADNYGWSVFSRYRLLPSLYGHAEYQMVNYEIFTGLNTSDREMVSFLLLGGGVSKNVGRNTWAYAEVLFDVLQSDKSPYEDWEPVISVGVGVGF